MPIMYWIPRYSIGIDFFDQQHVNLLNIMNLTQKCLDEGTDNDQLIEILIEMAEYSRYHFRAEEEFMKKIDFPKIEKHRLAHQSFIAKIQEARTLMDQKQLEACSIVLKINNYLQLWLIDHIQKMDKEFGTFYQDFAPVQLEDNYEIKQAWVWDLLKDYETKPKNM